MYLLPSWWCLHSAQFFEKSKFNALNHLNTGSYEAIRFILFELMLKVRGLNCVVRNF